MLIRGCALRGFKHFKNLIHLSRLIIYQHSREEEVQGEVRLSSVRMHHELKF